MIINRNGISIILSMFFLLNPFIVTAGQISGKVYDANSKKPIHKATVSCSKDPDKKDVIKEGLTDQNGMYHIKDIQPDDVYYITVEKGIYYEPEMSKEELGDVKKNFSLKKRNYYKIESLVIEVNVKSNTFIVEELTKGEKIKLSTTADTVISDADKDKLKKLSLSLRDIKIGDKVSIKYYGTTQGKGIVAEIVRQRKDAM